MFFFFFFVCGDMQCNLTVLLEFNQERKNFCKGGNFIWSTRIQVQRRESENHSSSKNIELLAADMQGHWVSGPNSYSVK